VVIVTGTGSEEVAVDAIRRGAADYVVKSPSHIQRLPQTIHRVLKEKRIEMEAEQAQEAARRTSRLNTLLLDSLPHPAMLIDRNHRIVAGNRITRHMGAQESDYCWRSLGQGRYIPEEDRAYLKAHKGHIPPGGTRCSFCLGVEALENDESTRVPEVEAFGRFWDIRWVPVAEDMYLHYAMDITDRKGAVEALQESERFSKGIAEEGPNPILVIQLDTSTRYVNQALVALTGFSREELLGRKAAYPWWTEETLQRTEEDFKKAMKHGVRKVEEIFKKKNGKRF
jgi:PAS domain S-box-containing protein